VYIGFALAFVLNRPCEFFYRLYDRGLGRSKAAKLSRPLAVVSAYMLLLLVIAAIFSFRARHMYNLLFTAAQMHYTYCTLCAADGQ